VTDDLFERALAAYRDRTGNGGDGSDAVLERIQRSRRAPPLLHRTRQRTVALTLAAALTTVGVWAGVSGRLPALVTRVAAFVRPDGEETPVAKPAVPRHAPVALPLPAPAAPAATPSTPDAEAPTPPVQHGPAIARRSHAAASTAAPPTATEPVPTTAVVAAAPDVDALYRVAHEAHFQAHDYAAALSAWNAYLAAAGPGSRMLIEARYNRGIALARLGHREEAVAALRPFADGEYGEYRKNEARRVIEKLEQ
jgi:hypothetical protein